LLVHGADRGRQQAVEAELFALGRRERGALVREGLAQHRFAAHVDRDVLLARAAIVLGRPLHQFLLCHSHCCAEYFYKARSVSRRDRDDSGGRHSSLCLISNSRPRGRALGGNARHFV
jgi:hypothetical protein